MQVQAERDIYIRATRCFELLNDAIRTFTDYLVERIPASDPQYYRARNFLKEGKAFFDQTLAEAKKLLGPIPVYAPKDFEQLRSQLLVENKIVVQAQTLEDLKSELQSDEFVTKLMTTAEIEDYLRSGFESQKRGKRKLQNIKVRMCLDKLAGLVARGQELQIKAQQKQQGLPY